jgi:hypothetical protein
MPRRTLLLFLMIVIVTGLLTGCDAAAERLLATLWAATPAPTLTPALPTDTPEPPMPETCAFVWSNRSLPDVTLALNQALSARALLTVEGQAIAYGEDCLDPVTSQVARFTAMQTDFYFSVARVDLSDTQVMGVWAEQILRVLEDFPPGEVPGPNPGYVSISFSGDGETITLWFPRKLGSDLLENGRRGSELFEALRDNF